MTWEIFYPTLANGGPGWGTHIARQLVSRSANGMGDLQMNMSPEVKNRLYLLAPLVWTGVLSLLARGTFLAVLTHWAFLLGWTLFVFALMCLVKLFFRQKFHWQKWFFWTGIVVPMIVLTHHHWK